MHEDQASISLIESILAEELRRELKLTHYVVKRHSSRIKVSAETITQCKRIITKTTQKPRF